RGLALAGLGRGGRRRAGARAAARAAVVAAAAGGGEQGDGGQHQQRRQRLPPSSCVHVQGPPPGWGNASAGQVWSGATAASAATAVSVPAGTIVWSSRGICRPRGVTARWTSPSSPSTANASATTTIVAAITPTRRYVGWLRMTSPRPPPPAIAAS